MMKMYVIVAYVDISLHEHLLASLWPWEVLVNICHNFNRWSTMRAFKRKVFKDQLSRYIILSVSKTVAIIVYKWNSAYIKSSIFVC